MKAIEVKFNCRLWQLSFAEGMKELVDFSESSHLCFTTGVNGVCLCFFFPCGASFAEMCYPTIVFKIIDQKSQVSLRK